MLDAVTNPMAPHNLREIFSPKSSSAISAVATISKLLSSEALAAVVLVRPIIRKMGAAISNATIPTV